MRHRLRQLCSEHGRSVLADPDRLNAYLRDVAPGRNAETHCRVSAVQEGVVGDLEKASEAPSIGAVLARLADRLHEQLAMDPAAARWTVQTLAYAMGTWNPAEEGDGSLPTESDAAGVSKLPEAPGESVVVARAASQVESEPRADGSRGSRARRVLMYSGLAIVVFVVGILVSSRIRPSTSAIPNGGGPVVQVTQAPVATGTTTPGPQPSTASPSAGPHGLVTNQDRRTMAGLDAIQRAVRRWAVEHDRFPSPEKVAQGGGLLAHLKSWPRNPYTGEAMAPGTAPGDFTYQRLNGGAGYQLTTNLANGLTYTLP